MKNRNHLSYLIVLFSMFAFVACKSHEHAVALPEVQFDAEDVWLLTQMQGKEFAIAPGTKKLSISFNPEAGTFNGTNGCNRYFGSYKDLGKGEMELSNFNATKIACPEPVHKIESSFMALLRRCNGYKLDQYTLQLTQNGKTLLTFEKVQQADSSE